MKILLPPPNAAESHRQQQLHHPIATVSESQLNHYLKLQAAQQQPSHAPIALLKNDSTAVEVSTSDPLLRPAVVVESQAQHQQQRFHNHLPIIKSEATPSTTDVVVKSHPSAIQQTQQSHHHPPQQHQNGHHHVYHADGVAVRKSPKFATAPNQPPLPHKKMIMGKIEHHEAMENEAAMQQHAHSLLQLSQEPLVLLLHNQRSSPPPPAQPQQQRQQHQRHLEKEPPPAQNFAEDVVYHQKFKDTSTVGYFMEVGPNTPSIRLTTAATDDQARNVEAATIVSEKQQQQRQLQQQHYNAALLQSRIFPKDEPMSPRSLASSPLASGSASPRSPISTSIGAAELTQRLAAKGLLPQQLPQFQHLQQPQQVVISPAETLVISTSAIDGENYIVSSANSPTSTVAVTTGSPDIPQTKIPGTTVYEGECGFRISFAPQMKETKSAQWTYSSMLHKLFTRINAACPIRFQCAYKLPPSGTILRALPIYMQPEHMCEAVVRCPVHAASPLDLETPQQPQSTRPTNHLIRADHPHAEYVDADPQYGRQSVSVPFEAPAVGTQWSTVLYRYMCNSSCAGGMNRRPIQTVFTLETPSGEVIGRQVVEVRICACPGRDSKVEERNVLNKGAEAKGAGPKMENGFILDGPLPSSSASSPLGAETPSGAGRKRKRVQQNEVASATNHDDDDAPNGNQGGDDRVFTLLVRGRETYELLKRIRDSMELSKMASNDQLERLQAMDAEMEQQINAASSLISFMSQPPENGHATPEDA